ncbi:MAG: carbonate dehydratase [Burkholderiaceae bacterium]|nr:carbonate dehydratase [Burkholderiaceae bacterium]MCD8517176.1 carbonate dehydratase [Burkholderiaceae bacterium]MCD8536442.1 carbonate dehydratase [Burkholderiaceae bacterium]MCD8565278.1 carbonate dehydratase [Burkholderiaceae bacterium]
MSLTTPTTTPDNDLTKLFERNRQWVTEVTQSDKDYFSRLVNQQSPEYLWIGCSDSRVPANQITGLAPGEVFVHRNIGNVVVHTDLNVLSVIEFAIEELKVKHIIVVGHYGCSGVKAAMLNRRLGLAQNWIRHIRDVQQKHASYLGHLIKDDERLDKLCELNVIEQVIHVCQTSSVQQAWDNGQPVTVHGWIYGLHDGLVRDLGVSIADAEQLQQRYESVLANHYTSA